MLRQRLLTVAVACASLAAACTRPSAPSPAPGVQEPAPLAESEDEGPTTAPPADATRIVAIGDVHGDLASTREALALAGAVDADGNWAGGDLVVVQLGDQTDRGDDELEILEWFDTLADQAEAAGGAFHALLGNHEVMNVQLDLRYVTPGGLEDFADTPIPGDDPAFAEIAPPFRGRVAAFRPGGPWARRLAEHPIALQLGDTVFVHAGLEPEFAAMGIDAINDAVAAWMRGEAPEPAVIRGEDTPIWSRDYSLETDDDDCAALAESLRLLDAERMVVGHTVQREGITSACDGRVWRVDVGLADYYGGPTEVLEIVGDDVRVLR